MVGLTINNSDEKFALRQNDLILLNHKDLIRFALFCTYQAKESWDKVPEAIEAIKVTELWLNNKVDSATCKIVSEKSLKAINKLREGASDTDMCDDIDGNAYAAVYVSAAVYDDSWRLNYANACVHCAIRTFFNSKHCPAFQSKIIKEQWGFYNELLNFDDIAEKALLGVEV